MKTVFQTLSGFLILILFFQSCNNEDFEYPAPDPDYPMVIWELSQNERAEKLVQLTNFKDIDDQVELNEFGFLKLSSSFNDSLGVDVISIRDLVFKKMEKYYSYFGFAEMPFEKFVQMFGILVEGFPSSFYEQIEEDDVYLNEFLQDQLKRSDSIIYSGIVQHKLGNYLFEHNDIDIILDFKTQTLTINGYWFSDVYIPVKDAITVSDAINIVLNDIIDYSSGEIFEFDMEQLKKSRKVILKRMVDGNYTFYLCWKIYIWNKFKVYYIDSQTGEIHKIDNYRHYI